MAILNPFTEQHCKDFDSVIAIYPHLKDTFEAFQECGLDCQEQLQTILAQYEICTKLKKKFNPLAQ